MRCIRESARGIDGEAVVRARLSIIDGSVLREYPSLAKSRHARFIADRAALTPIN